MHMISTLDPYGCIWWSKIGLLYDDQQCSKSHRTERCGGEDRCTCWRSMQKMCSCCHQETWTLADFEHLNSYCLACLALTIGIWLQTTAWYTSLDSRYLHTVFILWFQKSLGFVARAATVLDWIFIPPGMIKGNPTGRHLMCPILCMKALPVASTAVGWSRGAVLQWDVGSLQWFCGEHALRATLVERRTWFGLDEFYQFWDHFTGNRHSEWRWRNSGSSTCIDPRCSLGHLYSFVCILEFMFF